MTFTLAVDRSSFLSGVSLDALKDSIASTLSYVRDCDGENKVCCKTALSIFEPAFRNIKLIDKNVHENNHTIEKNYSNWMAVFSAVVAMSIQVEMIKLSLSQGEYLAFVPGLEGIPTALGPVDIGESTVPRTLEWMAGMVDTLDRGTANYVQAPANQDAVEAARILIDPADADADAKKEAIKED